MILFLAYKKLLHSLYFITYCIRLLFRGSSISCCNVNYYNSLWCIKEFSWFLYCVLWCTIQSIFKEGWKRFFANGAKVFWKIVNVAEVNKYLLDILIIISQNLSNSLLLIILLFLPKLQSPTYLDIFIHSKGTLIGYPITTHVRTLTSFNNARINKIFYKNHDKKIFAIYLEGKIS